NQTCVRHSDLAGFQIGVGRRSPDDKSVFGLLGKSLVGHGFPVGPVLTPRNVGFLVDRAGHGITLVGQGRPIICRIWFGHQRTRTTMRLTDIAIRRLPLPEKKGTSKIHYDDDVKGFGARVTANGARSFVLNYVTRSGRERRYTI